MRYTVRLVPIIVVVGAIAWFFLLRSPGAQTNTSGKTKTPETTTEIATSSTTPETKVADNSDSTSSTKGGSKTGDGKLPETGPADTLAIFAVAATAGTLFWEWRLQRVRQNSR
jgi:hypothetical protein